MRTDSLQAEMGNPGEIVLIEQFFLDMQLWQQILVSCLAAAIVGIIGFIVRRLWRKLTSSSSGSEETYRIESPSQVAKGKGITQEISTDKSKDKVTVAHIDSGSTLKVDRSQREVIIERVESGATVNIVFDYVDGVASSIIPDVRSLFKEGRYHYERGQFNEAIERLERCLQEEIDHVRLCAINIQLGNCYYSLRKYLKAAEYYAAGLREARKGNDREGEAAALGNMGNSYMIRPASDGRVRGQNVRKAVECYQAALEIRKKDEYPVQYATTQNNLGNAYTDLPTKTPEERAENVRKAVECYQAALEICRKDEYPVEYCYTVANIGTTLASVQGMEAESCQWLKEAYALKEYLPDQGKRLEKIMNEVCKE